MPVLSKLGEIRLESQLVAAAAAFAPDDSRIRPPYSLVGIMQHSDEIASEVRALQERGVEAATEFFEANRHRLRLFIMHRTDARLLGRLDWDDVMQETFIVVQTRFRDFVESPGVPFYVWMRALAGQVLIDLHRKHLGAKKRTVDREVSLHQRLPYQSTSISLAALLSAGGVTPSKAAVRTEQIEMLRQSIDEMSDMDREVLVLRHMEQMSNGEVAHALGIDKSAATKRYIRALKRIRQRVGSD